MGMSNKEAIKRGFEWKYYNPYLCRGDLVFITIWLIGILLCGIGFYTHPKIFLGISIFLGLPIIIVQLIDIMTAEKIKTYVKQKETE